jgi:drug/metabolite transporter (DMT)-like permease
MRNHERAFGERLWRAAVIAFGMLGAFAAIDAILFFFFLVGAVIVFAPPSPYIGLLMFVALPAAAVVGAAVAWTAYQVLTRRILQSQADKHHVAA